MLEALRKSVFLSIGALALTEEKIQKLTDKFIQKGKLRQKEEKSLVNEFQKVMQAHKTKLITMVNEHVKNLLKELNLATKTNLTELEQRLKKDFGKVENRLTKLEKQVKTQRTK